MRLAVCGRLLPYALENQLSNGNVQDCIFPLSEKAGSSTDPKYVKAEIKIKSRDASTLICSSLSYATSCSTYVKFWSIQLFGTTRGTLLLANSHLSIL